MSNFADEGEEVTYLAKSAVERRHLNDAQKVRLGKAFEDFFRPQAEERMKAGKPDPTANLPQGSNRAPTTDAKAADAVGMSERQYLAHL